ncbi:glycosyltransferase family 4 protein [Desulfallas thermosapovorans]|uniref:Glycosyltransferase involved in cell wall biosynthesis n=1 Tax=Desulfallas thermosapovorans DSM 6562 TaxID=1121431 RepID=A0A5S4ZTQ3_9FIRM|nr:glycosyltransferase family 4 protein [Desulfallas thermosapovorans]TYO96254.1 glycosyltransferase involved in cell wall biosynthesis [Desulfallas thermosapovorans DSM 6562]
MRVAMFSWEYPPKSVGGLAQHVYDLTNALAGMGVEIHLFTMGEPGLPEMERVNGVQVYRVIPYNVSSPDFTTWVAQLNVAMLEKAVPILSENNGFNIVHGHDWLVAYAVRALKHAFRIPLVATIHATEYGRNYGLHNDTQRHISDVEWWLCYEAWQVICCSHYMEGEMKYVFQIPDDKLKVVPNGVDPENFVQKNEKLSRNNYASADEKIVFYVGRLVREKGVQVLLDAVPMILARVPNTKFVIAGKGPYMQELQDQAARMGIAQSIYFTGYIDDYTRNSLYSWSDVAVFPSLYEPFGIVALEAMAARTPVVVSDTGGLSEIVRHNVDGLKAYPGNPRSLADMIINVLLNPQQAQQLRDNAYRRVLQKFSWRDIAAKTLHIYNKVWDEYRGSNWYVRQGGLFNRFSKVLGKN